MMKRTYRQLITYDTFEDRLKYLVLHGKVGAETFGFDRIFNQRFYKSAEWNQVKSFVITRDNGCDLGMSGCDICGRILVHHLNPITIEDLQSGSPNLLDPDFLISVSHETHNRIHYGYEHNKNTIDLPKTRSPNDMCPWR